MFPTYLFFFRRYSGLPAISVGAFLGFSMRILMENLTFLKSARQMSTLPLDVYAYLPKEYLSSPEANYLAYLKVLHELGTNQIPYEPEVSYFDALTREYYKDFNPFSEYSYENALHRAVTLNSLEILKYLFHLYEISGVLTKENKHFSPYASALVFDAIHLTHDTKILRYLLEVRGVDKIRDNDAITFLDQRVLTDDVTLKVAMTNLEDFLDLGGRPILIMGAILDNPKKAIEIVEFMSKRGLDWVFTNFDALRSIIEMYLTTFRYVDQVERFLSHLLEKYKYPRREIEYVLRKYLARNEEAKLRPYIPASRFGDLIDILIKKIPNFKISNSEILIDSFDYSVEEMELLLKKGLAKVTTFVYEALLSFSHKPFFTSHQLNYDSEIPKVIYKILEKYNPPSPKTKRLIEAARPSLLED